MLLRVTHRTLYRYAGQARESFNEARLRPLDGEGQRCLDFTLRLAPATEPPAVGTATRPSTALAVASYASAALTAATAGSFRGLRKTPRALEGKSARGSSFQVQVRVQSTLERVSEDEGEGGV